jgi:hypothetical protein
MSCYISQRKGFARMFRRLVGVLFVLFAVSGASSAFALDVRGARDHVLFRRAAGYEIVKYSVEDRSAAFPLDDGNIFLTGRLTEIFYRTKRQPLSFSALGSRFVSALRGAGGEIVFRENLALGGRRVVGKLARPGRDVWVMQDAVSDREYRLAILEAAAPGAGVIPPAVVSYDYEAEAQTLDLLDTVERTGKLDVPARFATGASALLKGYEADFKKCVMLMEKDPSLKFYIASYLDPGLKPSEQRNLLRERGAVLFEVLAAMGADRSRLTTELPASAPGDFTVPHGFARLTSIDSVNSAAQ